MSGRLTHACVYAFDCRLIPRLSVPTPRCYRPAAESTECHMNDPATDLRAIWQRGYSIGELWGASQPVSRGGPSTEKSHLIMWGILSIVDDQVRKGAGHDYMRERLWERDWFAIGYLDQVLTLVPPMKDAKFGRKPSAIGDGQTSYTDVRVVHARQMATVATPQVAA